MGAQRLCEAIRGFDLVFKQSLGLCLFPKAKHPRSRAQARCHPVVLDLQQHIPWDPLELHLFRCHPGLLSQKLWGAAKKCVLRSPLIISQT